MRWTPQGSTEHCAPVFVDVVAGVYLPRVAPNLVGHPETGIAGQMAALASAGWTWTVEYGEGQPGHVVAQDPAAGAPAPDRTLVLTVGAAPTTTEGQPSEPEPDPEAGLTEEDVAETVAEVISELAGDLVAAADREAVEATPLGAAIHAVVDPDIERLDSRIDELTPGDPAGPPTMPASLTAQRQPDGGIVLSWDAPDGDPGGGWAVYRRTGGQPVPDEPTHTLTDGAARTWPDAAAPAGWVNYHVRAVGGDGQQSHPAKITVRKAKG